MTGEYFINEIVVYVGLTIFVCFNTFNLFFLEKNFTSQSATLSMYCLLSVFIGLIYFNFSKQIKQCFIRKPKKCPVLRKNNFFHVPYGTTHHCKENLHNYHGSQSASKVVHKRKSNCAFDSPMYGVVQNNPQTTQVHFVPAHHSICSSKKHPENNNNASENAPKTRPKTKIPSSKKVKFEDKTASQNTPAATVPPVPLSTTPIPPPALKPQTTDLLTNLIKFASNPMVQHCAGFAYRTLKQKYFDAPAPTARKNPIDVINEIIKNNQESPKQTSDPVKDEDTNCLDRLIMCNCDMCLCIKRCYGKNISSIKAEGLYITINNHVSMNRIFQCNCDVCIVIKKSWGDKCTCNMCEVKKHCFGKTPSLIDTQTLFVSNGDHDTLGTIFSCGCKLCKIIYSNFGKINSRTVKPKGPKGPKGEPHSENITGATGPTGSTGPSPSPTPGSNPSTVLSNTVGQTQDTTKASDDTDRIMKQYVHEFNKKMNELKGIEDLSKEKIDEIMNQVRESLKEQIDSQKLGKDKKEFEETAEKFTTLIEEKLTQNVETQTKPTN